MSKDNQYPNHDDAVALALRSSRSIAHTMYPDEAIILALAVIKEGGSLRDACGAVQREHGKRPGVQTVARWTQHSAEAFAKLQPEKRREWESLAGRVFEVWSKRAIEAAEAKKEGGEYVVSHQQAMVPYGIAKDGLRSTLEAIRGQGPGGLAIQLNVSSGGRPERNPWGSEGTVEGEAREAPRTRRPD